MAKLAETPGFFDAQAVSDEFGIGEAFRCNGYAENFMLKAEHYKYLNAYSMHVKPRRVFEIGTQVGSSVAAFLHRRGSSVKVVAMDVNIGEFSTVLWKDSRVDLKKIPGDIVQFSNYIEFERMISSSDLIFVDAGHDGKYEMELARLINETGYTGIVLWDDVYLDSRMSTFWGHGAGSREVRFGLNWHGDCGFGASLFLEHEDV